MRRNGNIAGIELPSENLIAESDIGTTIDEIATEAGIETIAPKNVRKDTIKLEELNKLILSFMNK